MKAKRAAPQREGSDRRRARDAARGSRRPTADAASSPASRRTPAGRAKATRSGPQTNPIPRPVDRPARPKTTKQAKARAKARKAKTPRVVRPRLSERLAVRLASIDLRPRTLASKVPFVVLVIGSLGAGLALTLWLSTDSAERSYQLSHARERTRMLQQQAESLERDVRAAESAPALAEAARKQGMIPSRDAAHLVQDPSGNWVVVGSPKPADGVPPPPLNSKLPDETPPPAPKPPAPPEVAVRVTPAPGAPPAPATTGPELLLRGPDGSTTLGSTHLPATAVGPLPGMPGGPVTGQVPGVIPGQQPAPAATVPTAPPATAPGVAPAPSTGEQFAPVTTTAPGAPR